MIKGTAQKFETLQDGSCKLSTYYLREHKKQVLELEGEEVISMSVSEFKALSEGQGTGMSDIMRERLKTALENVIAILDKKEE